MIGAANRSSIPERRMAAPERLDRTGVVPIGRGVAAALLVFWAFVVLALYLMEHPTFLSRDLRAGVSGTLDDTPVVSGFSPRALFDAARGLAAACAIVLWAGLFGRSALARLARRRALDEPDDGEMLRRRDPFLPEERSLAVAIACALGFLTLTALVFALGIAGFLGTPLILIFAATLAVLIADNPDLLRVPREFVALPRYKTDRVLLPILIASSFAALVIHLSPVVGADALVYHLQIPRAYMEAHRIVPLPFNVYANMPHAAELLYTLALTLGGENGAKLLDLAFRVLLMLGLAGFGKRWLGMDRALLAPCILLANPLLIDNRTVANIDVAMALVLFAALAQALRWWETGALRHLLLSSAFLGLLAGMKYTGGLFGAALFVALIVLRIFRPRAPAPLWHLVLYPIPALLLFLPWLAKNQMFTGNPVYPLIVERFGGVEWNAELGRKLVDWQRGIGMGRSLGDYVLLPWNMTVKANIEYPSFDGILSPLFLMFIPAAALLLPLPPAAWALLAFSGLGLALWAWGPQQLRFFMPVLPALSLLAAWVVDTALSSTARRRWFGRAALALSVAYLAIFAIYIVSVTIPNQLPVVAGVETRGDYLHRRFQPHDAMMRAGKELPPNAKLVLVWENRGFYLARPYIADSFYEASWIVQLLEKDQSGDLFEKKLREEGVTHIMMNVPLGLHFGRYYAHPRVREALDRFLRERGGLLFEANGLVVAELRGKEPAKGKKPAARSPR
jgi:4-amino-4-deoxy-L-arabinose transferase-like glycosyltransferase